MKFQRRLRCTQYAVASSVTAAALPSARPRACESPPCAGSLGGLSMVRSVLLIYAALMTQHGNPGVRPPRKTLRWAIVSSVAVVIAAVIVAVTVVVTLALTSNGVEKADTPDGSNSRSASGVSASFSANSDPMVIGSDITPGTYRSTGGGQCIWLVRNQQGELVAGATNQGRVTVQIELLGTTFASSSGCVRWDVISIANPS